MSGVTRARWLMPCHRGASGRSLVPVMASIVRAAGHGTFEPVQRLSTSTASSSSCSWRSRCRSSSALVPSRADPVVGGRDRAGILVGPAVLDWVARRLGASTCSRKLGVGAAAVPRRPRAQLRRSCAGVRCELGLARASSRHSSSVWRSPLPLGGARHRSSTRCSLSIILSATSLGIIVPGPQGRRRARLARRHLRRGRVLGRRVRLDRRAVDVLLPEGLGRSRRSR